MEFRINDIDLRSGGKTIVFKDLHPWKQDLSINSRSGGNWMSDNAMQFSNKFDWNERKLGQLMNDTLLNCVVPKKACCEI